MQPETPQRGARRRTVVFVTYTMANPYAVGVFFRALRLSFEFHRRGWSFVVCNIGPIPDDPKVQRARELGDIRSFGGPDGATNKSETLEILRRIDPALIVFGEEPFPGMEPFYEGARMLGPPFAVLDQYYNPNVSSMLWGVDLLLLYGLRCLWPGEVDRPGKYVVIPPFIDEVTPTTELAAPPHWKDIPWVTVLGFDERVLRGGIELIQKLEHHRPAVITLSRDPRATEALLEEANIPADRRLALPLLPDAQLFGWMAASRTVILANGFMQMMEALALGCPALCIDRGIGMPGWSLDETFLPYVSIGETPAQQRARLDGWLEGCPFSAAQLDALRRERGGARAVVDHLERVVAHPRLRRRLERVGSRLKWSLQTHRSPEPRRGADAEQ